MPRYRLDLEYDGRGFHGFQAQGELPTVQACVERAVKCFCGETLRLQAAGRTDAGVHALQQVVHLDLERNWPPEVVRDALNAHLVPEPIAVICAERAPEGFHARFSAKARRYLYRIANRVAPPTLDQGRVWHVKKSLDASAMAEAAKVLVGHHDFSTFRDVACQAASPVKTLDVAQVRREGPEIWLAFAARSFLHRQVRSMTGSLAEVGAGRWTIEDLRVALEARQRAACGPVAPACGLYLAAVDY
jgi:tRNA pseudouridine38-40 synthase